jgi:acetyl esterase/lipase
MVGMSFSMTRLQGEERLPEQVSSDRIEASQGVDHRDLMHYIDSDRSGERRMVKTPEDWALRRRAILTGMQLAMGQMPGEALRVPLVMEQTEEIDHPRYWQRRIRYQVEADDFVPAWLFLPKEKPTPSPAMLCLHQTIAIGKDEPAGLGGSPNLQYARELAERGYVCLVPDYPSFGEYAYDFAAHADRFGSGTMKAIWNNMRAVDLLESLVEVDADRIGCIGHSLGGHNALFTAAFDSRLRATITSCGFTPFHHYYEGKLAGWTSDRYMPRIREQYDNDPDKVPFDFYEVLGAIAPRAIFVNAPLSDSNFEVTGVRKVEAEIAKVFELLKAPNRTRFEYPDSGHDFPPETRENAYRWLEEQL